MNESAEAQDRQSIRISNRQNVLRNGKCKEDETYEWNDRKTNPICSAVVGGIVIADGIDHVIVKPIVIFVSLLPRIDVVKFEEKKNALATARQRSKVFETLLLGSSIIFN